jgi:hypothetical protein
LAQETMTMNDTRLSGWRYYWRLLLRGGEGGLISWSPDDARMSACPACGGPNVVTRRYFRDRDHWLCLDCQARGAVPEPETGP